MSGFSGNFIFEYLSQMCRENSSIIKIVVRVTGTAHEDQNKFLSYFAQFFLE
jgi:hypothetical protein